MKKDLVIRRMCESGVLPVFRTCDVRHLFAATKAIHASGIACVEYTLTMPDALDLVREAVRRAPKGLLIGAGTVMDGATVKRAVKAGASFVACPGFSPDMVKECKRLGVTSVVGAITPTEIMEALKLGADVIKVFPAPSVGPTFFAEMKGPFPGVRLMAAGGMSPANLAEYVQAGAEVITCLANGLDAVAYCDGNTRAITSAARKWVEAVQKARRQSKR